MDELNWATDWRLITVTRFSFSFKSPCMSPACDIQVQGACFAFGDDEPQWELSSEQELWLKMNWYCDPPSPSGYHISPDTLNIIIKRYNKRGSIYFDDYVACCVKLQAHTGNDATQVHWNASIPPFSLCFFLLTRCLFPFPVTANFKRKDIMNQGSATFKYDEVSPFLFVLFLKFKTFAAIASSKAKPR